MRPTALVASIAPIATFALVLAAAFAPAPAAAQTAGAAATAATDAAAAAAAAAEADLAAKMAKEHQQHRDRQPGDGAQAGQGGGRRGGRLCDPRRHRRQGLPHPAGADRHREAAAGAPRHPGVVGLERQHPRHGAALAGEGYLVLAVDLYEGKVATTPEAAMAAMQGAMERPARLLENLRQAEATSRPRAARRRSASSAGASAAAGRSRPRSAFPMASLQR